MEKWKTSKRMILPEFDAIGIRFENGRGEYGLLALHACPWRDEHEVGGRERAHLTL